MEDSSIRAAGLVAAVVPAFLILYYFATAGRTRMDDGDLWNCFALGACIGIPVSMIVFVYEAVIGYPDGVFEAALAEAFIGAALPEEAFKLIALLGICGSRLGQIPPSRIIVLGVAMGCGFAVLENIFYVVADDRWIGTAIVRCITAIPGHAFMGAVMGACITKAIHGGNRFLWWALAYIAPVLMHGVYNFWRMAIEAARDASQAWPPGIIEWLIIGFIATVIFEGALAHFCLRWALRRDKLVAPEKRLGASLPPTLDWLTRPKANITFWGIVSGIFFLAAFGGFWISLTQERLLNGDLSNLWLLRGYSAFAMLHGLAFAGLALVIWRRRNTGSTVDTGPRSRVTTDR